MIKPIGMQWEFQDVYARIKKRYPTACAYWQSCQLTMAVIPRAHVSATYHFLVEDVEFRDEVAKIIENSPHLNGVRTNYKGDDAVLILCPVQ